MSPADAFDIAAIQFLYGANMTTRTGNDSYRVPDTNAAGTYWTCIWDAGGTDLVYYAGAVRSRLIAACHAVECRRRGRRIFEQYRRYLWWLHLRQWRCD